MEFGTDLFEMFVLGFTGITAIRFGIEGLTSAFNLRYLENALELTPERVSFFHDGELVWVEGKVTGLGSFKVKFT